MEVGRGPNWGCSAKEKKKAQNVSSKTYYSKCLIIYRWLRNDALTTETL
jgi:hypothetical protein